MRSIVMRQVLLGLGVLLLSVPAWAATITVTNTDDAGAGSLRQAIADASPGDTITFDLAAYPATITLSSGQLQIETALTITGPGVDQLAIDGATTTRVFYNAIQTVTISGLTIRNGNASTGGGGIFNGGLLTLTDCAVSGNTATGSDGGGIYNGSGGTVTLTNCTVSGNTATGENSGGGIFNAGTCSLTLANCTVSGNMAGWDGGGIKNYRGSMDLANCTVSGNTATYGGGIHNAQGTATLTSSTVSGNTAITGNGGIYNYDTGSLTVKNSIIANNTANSAPSDCGGTPAISGGYNLIENAIGWTSSPTDITGVDPVLGPLQDNGGPTFTHALLDGSPAIDAIPEGGDGYNGAPATDQRGENRPSPAAGNCDIGAYEVQAAVAADTPRPIFGGSSGCGANRAPVPNAGPDQVVCVGERVTLDGSASYDPDEGIPQNVIMGAVAPQYVNQQRANLQFQWEVAVLYYAAGQPVLAIPDGADISASLQGFDSEIGSFIPNVPGIYQFDLFITDDHGDTVSDRILITCLPCHSADDQAVIESSFERFIVSPNPFDDQVKFGFVGEGLAEVIKGIVFDLSGHRVWEGQVTDADELLWDGRCLDGRLAASAPYIYTIILIENGRMHTETGTVFIQR